MSRNAHKFTKIWLKENEIILKYDSWCNPLMDILFIDYNILMNVNNKLNTMINKYVMSDKPVKELPIRLISLRIRQTHIAQVLDQLNAEAAEVQRQITLARST